MNTKAQKAATERLRAIEEKPRMRSMYGKKKLVRPKLVDEIFGDGRELMILSPIGGALPNYFVVRVGEGWVGDGGPDATIREHLDAIYDSIEDQFGKLLTDDDGEPEEELRFPDAVDFNQGSYWGTAEWPEGCAPPARRKRRAA